jgi:pimeloyl-ACP methyl ester carboxylesterase
MSAEAAAAQVLQGLQRSLAPCTVVRGLMSPQDALAPPMRRRRAIREKPMNKLPCSPSISDINIEYRTVEVGALRMFYRAAGDLSKPAFLLLHGFPSSSHMFRDLIPRLARHFRVIAPDLPGFGHSDSPALSEFAYSFDALADKVDGLLGQLGVDHYFAYLHDYGGPVGWRLATRHPGRVLGQVIQNANAYTEGMSEMAASVLLPLWQRGDEAGARALLQAEATRMQYTQGASDSAALNPDAWTLDQALLERPGNDRKQMALFRDYASNVALYGVWQDYFRRSRPKTLVAWGSGDPLFTVDGAEAYLRDLPDARLELLEGSHFALEEHAPRVADLILETFG